MKLIRYLFISVLSLFILVSGALLLLQSRWTKEQLSQVLQEVALQAGIQLTIEKIEGELPLKWTFTNINATLPSGDTLDIDRLRLRIAFFPLLRGHLRISYLHADHTKIVYEINESPSSAPMKSLKGSFSLGSASFDEITVVNRKTDAQMLYTLQGKGRWVRGGQSFYLEGEVHSKALDLNLFCEGSKKIDLLQTVIDMNVHSTDAFAPFYTIPYDAAFEIKSRAQGSWLTWKSLVSGRETLPGKEISGNFDVNVIKLTLPNVEPQTFELSSKFSLFGDRSWTLSHLAILSPFIQLQGFAEFNSDGLPNKLHTSVSLPDLSHFSSYLKGHANGEIDLRDEKCHVTLSTPEFTIDKTTFHNGSLELLAQIQENAWTAALEMKAEHPNLGYEASSELTWSPKNTFEVKSFDLVSKSGRIAGDVVIQNPKQIFGGANFQITDLSHLSDLVGIDLAGIIGGEIQFEGDQIEAHAIAKHLKVSQFLSSRVEIDLSHLKLFSPLEGKINVLSDEAFFRDIYFTSFRFEMGPENQSWNYFLNAKGEWKGPFDLLTQGQVDYSPGSFQLVCNKLSGTILDKKLTLNEKCSLELSHHSFKAEGLDLSIDNGHLKTSARWDDTQAAFKMSAEHFPLDFLALFTSRFSLKGLSSIDIDLAGANDQLEGHLNFVLEHADIYPAGSSKPIQTKGTLQANLFNQTLQLHTHLVATEDQICNISLSLPIEFKLDPLDISIPRDLPIAGQCTIEGYTQQLFDFINIGSQRVGGFLSCRLLLSGSLNTPVLYGPLSVQGGFYENYFIGIAIKDANVTAQATGHELIIEKATTTDGEKGSSEATGIFYLKKHLPFHLEGTIEHFRVIRFDWLTGACSGPFTIDGDLEGALAKGKLTLDEADVTIPDQLPSDLPILPIMFINEPESHFKKFQYSEPYPFRYDLDVHGDHDLRLSGRGIEAELEGDIHMTGKNLSVIATGALHTKKGKFSFAGKDFTINQGEILFSEEKSFLNITSTVEYPSLTVTVHFRGDLRSPQLIFESNPSMPTSSILSRILFNKDVSELSAAQAIQLANTIVTLSGSSGPNVLESIRKNLGIDRLSFSSDEETGNVSVQIGKYITQGVMISLTQSTESSQVKVEVELKAGFVLEAETQADNQGKFSFKWNKNY
jgi:autotransporter translocation and assembly factor TamB